MNALHRIGDLYHKYAYRHITRVSGNITDLTSYAISDIGLGPCLYIKELFALSIPYAAYKISTNQSHSLSYYLTEFGVAAGIALGVYGLNFLRTPLEEKLGLQLPTQLDKDREVRYAIKRANEHHQTPALTMEEVNDRANRAIDDLVINVEGYRVAHANKTKRSFFSRAFVVGGIDGLMNPILHEVVMTNDKCLGVITHEKAHLVGYARENEAQFVTYAAMQRSNDPSLRYLSYLHRVKLCREEFKLTLKDLEEYGLNPRSLEEIRSGGRVRRDGRRCLSTYKKIKIGLGARIRSAMLWALGQGNLLNAYTNKPLRMITAFDPAEMCDPSSHQREYPPSSKPL